MTSAEKGNRRPEVIASPKWVRVFLGGEAVAGSKHTLLLRAQGQLPVYYFPAGDVRQDLLEPAGGGEVAEQGEGPWPDPPRAKQVFTARVGDAVVENIAWHYPFPNRGYEAIQNLLAFYQERIDDFYVDGERLEKLKTAWS